MTNELATQEDLLQKYGALADAGEPSDSKGLFPKLTIGVGIDTTGKKPKQAGVFYMYKGKDEDGNEIEAEEVLTVKFRPLSSWQCYKEWTQEDGNWSVVNETIFFKDFKNSEAIDKKGTIACGRPIGQDFRNLTQEEQLEWKKKVKVYRGMFGLVNIEGEDELVFFETSGGKMARVNEALKKVQGKALYNVAFDLSLKGIDNKDSNHLQIAIDRDYSVEDTSALMGHLKNMDDFIRAHNEVVTKEHYESLKESQEDATIEAEVMSGVIEAEVEEIDIDDELPL